MKLAAHYNRANIIITLLVLFVGAVIYFFAINYIAKSELDRNLLEETEETADFIAQHHRLPLKYELEDQQTLFEKTTLSNIPNSFFDTLYTDTRCKKPKAGRAELSLMNFNGQNYKTFVIISRANTEYFIQLITCITLVLVVGLLLTLFLTNRYLLNDLWRPFYATLREMKVFNVSDEKGFDQQKGKVDEFNELNDAVRSMAVRVRNDFLNLKQFTENASHEMMTPLAVITAKLDMLIQDETLKSAQFEQLTDIYSATGKLSRLNQSLLLLVKIENNLIHNEESIAINQLLAEKLKQFQELIAGKNIELKQQLHPLQIFASRYLVDILLNNLLSNAIRHNIENGNLIITLTDNTLIFQNTGYPSPLNSDLVFERFHKGQGSDGTGLGLAIVKNICNMYNWKVTYGYTGQMHTFKITFL